jgi:hypothetical protein
MQSPTQSPELPPHLKELFDNLSALPSPHQCRKCGSELMHVNATFFSLGERVWNLPLPVCPRCEDLSKFIPARPNLAQSGTKMRLR